jgi:imidazolonepropionase-like amidohydrolase
LSGPLHLRGVLLPSGEERDLYVRDGLITFEPVPGAETVLRGGWIVPGLVDAHCHLSLSPSGVVSSEEGIRAQAYADRDAGALLLRNPGAPVEARFLDADPAAPRVLRAGRHLARPKRYIPGLAVELTGPPPADHIPVAPSERPPADAHDQQDSAALHHPTPASAGIAAGGQGGHQGGAPSDHMASTSGRVVAGAERDDQGGAPPGQVSSAPGGGVAGVRRNHLGGAASGQASSASGGVVGGAQRDDQGGAASGHVVSASGRVVAGVERDDLGGAAPGQVSSASGRVVAGEAADHLSAGTGGDVAGARGDLAGVLAAAVVEQATRGDGWVKLVGDWIDRAAGDLTPLWSLDELRAAVAAAHGVGARVAVHTFSEDALPDLIAAGVDSIEHGTGLLPDTVSALAASGAALVPTLINTANFPAIADSAARYPAYADHMRRLHATAATRIREAYEAGVPIYVGTDAGGQLPHGSVTAEIRALHGAGLSTVDALAAGSWAARGWLGLPGLEEGAPADLVAYGSDPRLDLSTLDSPLRIVLRGRVIR